jgi:hypothetical protein
MRASKHTRVPPASPPPRPREEGVPANRKEARRAQTLTRRMRLGRPQGTGYGKHAMSGLRFRVVHVNWTQRIIKQHQQSKRVKEYLDGKNHN